MCGIVGIAGQHDLKTLLAMNDLIVYRGPNDSGYYQDPGMSVGLAMKRLSILDLTGGTQPMANQDKSLWIVFNGEIYNSPEIRSALEKRGRRFTTRNSDTEVLLHLYAEKQERMLDELNGMFAFVIYDRARKRLFGARDRIGIKPFYYCLTPDHFAFASEMKCLLLVPGLEREVNPQSLFHYLSLGYVPGNSSIISSIRKLEPGHWFSYDLPSRNFSTHQYWDLTFKPQAGLKPKECVEFVSNELRQAVSRWTLSDVPIGCSLSGGLDSSSIVAMLSDRQNQTIKTYSLGFAESEADELNEIPLARKVAQRYQTEHHELILRPGDILRDILSMVWHLDEPYGGGLPSWYVFEFMSKDVKVGLTGTGGDEIFGDYGKFTGCERSVFAAMALSSWADQGGSKLKPLLNLFPSFREPLKHCYFDVFYYFSDEAKRKFVLEGIAAGTEDTVAMFEKIYRRGNSTDPRNAFTYCDFKTQLPEEFLLMTDRFSMAHSLEARVPFLDHIFIEKMMTIPTSIRTRRNDLKYLLRSAVKNLLPGEILQAEKKGFILPTAKWIRGALRPAVERLLSPECLKDGGFFKPEFYHRYVRPHLDGRADYHKQIWFLLMFQLWSQVFIKENNIGKPTFSLKDL